MFTQIAQSSQHCTTMKVLWDFAIDIHVASFHTSRGLLQVLLTSTFYEFCQKHFGASFSSTITLLHDEGCDRCINYHAKGILLTNSVHCLKKGGLMEKVGCLQESLLMPLKEKVAALCNIKRIPIHFLDNNPQSPEWCLT